MATVRLDTVVPTPHYNHTILEDGVLKAHLELLHGTTTKCPGYGNAYARAPILLLNC